jgi:hypothetical protein
MKSRGRAKQGFRDYQHQQNCMGDDWVAAAYVETQFHVPFFRNVCGLAALLPFNISSQNLTAAQN